MRKKFQVEGMTCAACQSHVQKSVSKLNGVISVNVNLLRNSMDVEFDEKECSVSLIEEAVTKAGYKAYLPSQKNEEKQKDYDLRNLIIAAIFLLVLMYISMGHMFSFPLPSFLMGLENGVSFAFTQLLLTIPVLVIYHRYFVSGYKKLFKLSPNMDSLIAISATASIVYGIIAIYMIGYGLGHQDFELAERYHMNLYFESAAMILTLVSFGKYLEKISKRKTTKALEKLMDLAPKKAVLIKDNQEFEISVEEVKIGDHIVVKKGDAVPIDGVVIDGSASINQANITGESMPVTKKIGDTVYASTMMTTGYLVIEATKVGDDTSIASIIKLVEEASSSKAPISKLVDKISGIFVPIILGIAIISFLVFFILDYGIEESFNFGVSVLVIACPCALGLATPVAIMVGTGKGAECGLLIKNAEILERAQYIKTIVLDKTGTLTEGQAKVTNVISFDDNLLEYAYSIENKSEHPLAQAIVEYCKNQNIKQHKVENFTSLEGMGINGIINNQEIYAGNMRLVNKLHLENKNVSIQIEQFAKEGKTPLIFMTNNQILGIIAIADSLKSTSKDAVQTLKKMGIEIVMLTGDNALTANKIAFDTGIDKVYSDVFPAQKQEIISSLRKGDSHHLIAMVGDGVNDAPALMASDIGIAVGGGSDVALESSDIVLLRKDLLDVQNVILLSKRVFRTIKGNLFWAFFYNCVGIILASGILYPAFSIRLNPMIGALAMSCSSVFVVCNALTIYGFKAKRNNQHNIHNKGGKEIMKTIEIKVEGMMCPRCKAHVEKALLSVDGVVNAEASVENKKAIITCEETIQLDLLIEAVNKEGYSASKLG